MMTSRTLVNSKELLKGVCFSHASLYLLRVKITKPTYYEICLPSFDMHMSAKVQGHNAPTLMTKPYSIILAYMIYIYINISA